LWLKDLCFTTKGAKAGTKGTKDPKSINNTFDSNVRITFHTWEGFRERLNTSMETGQRVLT